MAIANAELNNSTIFPLGAKLMQTLSGMRICK